MWWASLTRQLSRLLALHTLIACTAHGYIMIPTVAKWNLPYIAQDMSYTSHIQNEIQWYRLNFQLKSLALGSLRLAPPKVNSYYPSAVADNLAAVESCKVLCTTEIQTGPQIIVQFNKISTTDYLEVFTIDNKNKTQSQWEKTLLQNVLIDHLQHTFIASFWIFTKYASHSSSRHCCKVAMCPFSCGSHLLQIQSTQQAHWTEILVTWRNS